MKTLFKKTSQNSDGNNCDEVSILQETCDFITKETQRWVFSCDFFEILKTHFLQNAFG